MYHWDINRAREAYNINHWGSGFFDVNREGHMVANPTRGTTGPYIDLYQLAHEIQHQGLALPVLVRFHDILHRRVSDLCNAFDQAIEVENYRGHYTAVYPIKVNQQRSVVEEILRHQQGRVGLESGSKPELMAVLGMADREGGVIICNGYKDREYIRLALIGQRLGHRVYIVLEKQSELELVLEEARKLQVTPLLGIRLKLASMSDGKWKDSGGDRSKFGFTASAVLRVIERLREAGSLESLQLLHFHLGSQIANIRDIQRGLRECGRYYAELRELGVPISQVDVGGGLGVDYEGTRSRSVCSANYSMKEYANNVVHAFWEVCEERDLPHPHLISESGRAITAHHSVLITNVIDAAGPEVNDSLPPPDEDAPLILHDLWDCLTDMSSRSTLETYHDVVHWMAEAQSMFNHHVLDLQQRAYAEQLHSMIIHRLSELLNPAIPAHRAVVDDLHEWLAEKYFCNFSLFQSIPDAWAIDQVFPVVPLHRLDEPPTRRGIIEDITCDSDGRIDYYVNSEGVQSTLPLHKFKRGKDYLLGMFLTGAYQEILGDMHNLFGDTDSVDVVLEEQGGYRLEHAEPGDTVDDLLRYVHFEPEVLRNTYRAQVERADLAPAERHAILEELEHGIGGYTYLEE